MTKIGIVYLISGEIMDTLCYRQNHCTTSTMKERLISKERFLLLVFHMVMLYAFAFALTTNAASVREILNTQDKQFLKSAAQFGKTEMNASRLVLQKSTNTDVKFFAQTMIDHHTKLGSQLQRLAAAKNFTVPTSIDLGGSAKIIGLRVLGGGNYFDKEYLNVIAISTHQDVVDLFQKAERETSDPEIKQFAVNSLPQLRSDLEMAKELQTSLQP